MKADNVKIKTFEEFSKVVNSATEKRLNEFDYRDSRMQAAHAANSSLKSLLTKIKFLRNLRFVLDEKTDQRLTRMFKKDFMNACIYSDAIINDFQSNTDEYRKSFDLMSDNWSRELFLSLLAGEMLMDLRYGIPFQQFSNDNREYCHINNLPDCPRTGAFIHAGEVFVDCGAYTGDTLKEFIDSGYPPKKYFGFEPDPQNSHKAQNRLSASNIDGTIFNAAVSKQSGVLHFSTENINSASHRISDEGNVLVNALSIDETIKEPVTFIKMDIEGGECDALEGAAFTIKKYKPKLAISVYHKHTDFRRIPPLIKRINPEYSEFYMRYLSRDYSAHEGFTEVALFVR